ncbi:MAG TPA: hypothetical protein VFU04_03805 [Solirubrobacterales bacterium]|nr:hypothetical protein [Solirubrobacterales bacterium]
MAVRTSRGCRSVFDPAAGPYSRYNARRSTPAQVARDFIPPDYYGTLRDTIDPQLVVGPRGIGKTTLLKMLLPEAIDAWNSPEAQVARERIGYTGVFVAADKMWAGQFDQLADPLQGDALRTEARGVFARAAFAYMALSAFAEAAAYRCRPDGDPSGFRWVKISPKEEERLAAAIAPAWMAHSATSTFSSLSDQMQNNVASLGQVMQAAGMPGVTKGELRRLLRKRLLHVDFFTAAVRFIEAFNRAAGEREEPWVLLVDEFEFLPPAARALLGGGFQGRDPRLSYKISLAPYTGLGAFGGSQFDDWDKVELLPPHNPADDRFTQELLVEQLASLGRPEKVLKGPGFGPERKNSFRPESRNASDIEKLAAFDEGFERWLGKVLKGMSLEEAAENPRRRRALSKAMPLVRLRLEYHKQHAEAQGKRRPRHAVPTLYGGLRNVFAISEGNPRWIKALAHALREQGRQDKRAISPNRQARAIAEVAYKLYDKLKAVNIETSAGGEPKTTYTEYGELTPRRMLDALGVFLKTHTHDRAFSPDVPAAFKNDIEDDAWLEDVLNSLVFLGAIIVEKRSPRVGYETIRLARMWAPIFELLPRRGPSRSLKQALNHPSARRIVKRSQPGQEKLDVEGDSR